AVDLVVVDRAVGDGRGRAAGGALDEGVVIGAFADAAAGDLDGPGIGRIGGRGPVDELRQGDRTGVVGRNVDAVVLEVLQVVGAHRSQGHGSGAKVEAVGGLKVDTAGLLDREVEGAHRHLADLVARPNDGAAEGLVTLEAAVDNGVRLH